MNVVAGPEAKRDLAQIDKQVRKSILNSIEALGEDPLPENSYVIQLPDGDEVQCLKLQEKDRNSELNHRVTYDIQDGKVRVYGVFHRKPGYQEIKERTTERRE